MARILAALLLLAAAPAGGGATRRLECTLVYGGESRVVVVPPAAAPYSVPSVDVSGRFEFRAVRVDAPADEARLAFYVYASQADGPLLLHEQKLRPPFARGAAPDGVTGRNFVYEPRLGREFQYACGWSGR